MTHSEMKLAKPAPQIRDAATVIVIRQRKTRPQILMGQRGSKAVFMPDKFVFPGGAVDPGDVGIDLLSSLNPTCAARLATSNEPAPATLATCAIRELFEETGLFLGKPGAWPDPVAEGWSLFAEQGLRPGAQDLQFVFRAITPPGRPRRFDARFFRLDAEALIGDATSFSLASDELSHLQWIDLEAITNFDLPFITEVVIAEIAAQLDNDGPPARVPFFSNDAEERKVAYIT